MLNLLVNCGSLSTTPHLSKKIWREKRVSHTDSVRDNISITAIEQALTLTFSKSITYKLLQKLIHHLLRKDFVYMLTYYKLYGKTYLKYNLSLKHP